MSRLSVARLDRFRASAAETGSRVVIAIAPLAFDPSQPATRMLKVPRGRFNRQLIKEARDVTRAGAQLLILRPSGSELRHHGLNLLRRHGNEAVYESAYESTARRLASDDALAVLEAARA